MEYGLLSIKQIKLQIWIFIISFAWCFPIKSTFFQTCQDISWDEPVPKQWRLNALLMDTASLQQVRFEPMTSWLRVNQPTNPQIIRQLNFLGFASYTLKIFVLIGKMYKVLR